MSEKNCRKKHRIRRKKKQIREKTLTPLVDIMNSSTLDFTRKEITDLLNPILRELVDELLNIYNRSIAITKKEEKMYQSSNLTPSISNLTLEEIDEVLKYLASTSSLKIP